MLEFSIRRTEFQGIRRCKSGHFQNTDYLGHLRRVSKWN